MFVLETPWRFWYMTTPIAPMTVAALRRITADLPSDTILRVNPLFRGDVGGENPLLTVTVIDVLDAGVDLEPETPTRQFLYLVADEDPSHIGAEG